MQNQKDKTISTRFAPDSNPQDHGSLGKLRMKSRTTANRKTYTKQSKHNTHAFWMSGFWQSLGHILFWLGVRNALSNSLIDHIWQFCGLANHAKFEKGIFNIIWLARSWSIWKERNSCLFQQKAISRESLVAFGYGLFQNALILYMIAIIGEHVLFNVINISYLYSMLLNNFYLVMFY
jgi:hypothetical protein